MRVGQISEPFGSVVEGSPGENVSDVDPQIVKDLIKSRGVVMFSGFGSPLEEFEGYIRTFGEDFMTYQGGGYIRRKVSSDDTLLSTRYDHGREKQETFGLPLHGEMYYTNHRPVMLWFYCQKPAASEGETTVCDGAQIYEALSDETKELLASKKLKYIRHYLDGEWQKIYQTDDIDEAIEFCAGNGIEARVVDGNALKTEYVYPGVIKSRWGGHRVYINNVLPVVWQEQMGRKTSIVRFEDGSEIPQKLIDEVSKAQERLVIPLPWKAGDFAAIDNTRALHGRRAFTDTDREVFLRMVHEVSF
ncbi:MAG TPA: TauD/TfdA family dioxygenase [Propylenella sp.]|nr:TauD/TfdA family dioxygenase [Propylenella sp.]